MAAFTFRAGNAAGLRRLPLYLLGAVATLLVPRTPRLWVLGSGIGPGEGALPLLRLARAELPSTTRLVWLAGTDTEADRARSLGLDVVPKMSARGLWLTLRAQVLVVTHGLGDVNRYGTRGGFVVQLWHGIPLKRLHLDAPVAQTAPNPLARAVVRRGYRAVGRQIRLFPVASAALVDRVVSAFGVDPAAVAVTGDPRDDALLRGDDVQRRASALALLAAAIGPPVGAGPVVLYAPTWRDGGPDPAAPADDDWAAITDWLDRVDGELVVRSHPLGRADYTAGPARSARVRLLDPATVPDLCPLLPAFDHLVTDYSSVAFDFALTGGSTVFLAADVDGYLRTRGLYEPYDEFTGGRHVRTWPEALARLDELLDPGSPAATAAREHSIRLRDTHFDHLDGCATERVLAEIRRRTGTGGDDGGAAVAPAARPAQQRAVVWPLVRSVRVEQSELVVHLDAGTAPVDSALLAGARRRVPADVEKQADGVRLRVPLLVSRWGEPDLALPSGRYRLLVGGVQRLDVSTAELPTVLQEKFRAVVRRREGGLEVEISAPLTDAERSPATQREMRAAALAPRRRREHAVYFESFYGRTAADNPLAIDRVVARDLPDVRRYWSVTDRSVAVPDGAVPLVEYSREWWRVRAEARVYVVNDWLRWTHRRRQHQHVLQTWHGTMLKRLALDRADHTPRQRFAAVRQGWRWHALLAQNRFSADIFRSAYAFRGPIWETGYPRNDVLRDEARAAHVRRTLRLDPDDQVVLYAPTWRDNRPGLVNYLDLPGVAEALPRGHVLLVRGHTRTLAHGETLDGPRLLDVTTYPDVADLMLVADVLVTDYSSVMFDFAGTGKPMVFFTPDLDEYSESVRGFYFDLRADAPGPVVETRDDLLAAVEAADGDRPRYAAKYAAWQEKFTPYDDGHAAARVVKRMVESGWFG